MAMCRQKPAGDDLTTPTLDPAGRRFRPAPKGARDPGGSQRQWRRIRTTNSNLYDDAWMPNMERITWSGIALHGGPLPGIGCR